MNVQAAPDATFSLPEPFLQWFASRGWAPREHQLELLAKARAGRSVLLIAPTGAGKTLAGFLPSLVELSTAACAPETASLPGTVWSRPRTGEGQGAAANIGGGSPTKLISTGRGIRRDGGLHTLYISPLKALAVDIARNLERPVVEMGLPIRIETRTGDTPSSKRQRRRRAPREAPAPASRPAANSAHHTRAACAGPGLARCALSFRVAQADRAGRVACAGDVETGRSALPRIGATVHARPRSHQRRAVRDGGRAGRSAPLSGSTVRSRRGPGRSCGGARECGTSCQHARHGRAPALGRAFRPARDRRGLPTDQGARYHAHFRQYA